MKRIKTIILLGLLCCGLCATAQVGGGFSNEGYGHGTELPGFSEYDGLGQGNFNNNGLGGLIDLGGLGEGNFNNNGLGGFIDLGGLGNGLFNNSNLQGFDFEGGFNNEGFGHNNLPLGNGLLLLAAMGLGYACMKRKDKSSNDK